MEDNLLYMDVHLNILATTDKSSPMALIATLSTCLEGWWRGMQEMDNTFTLHTWDENYKSQKVGEKCFHNSGKVSYPVLFEHQLTIDDVPLMYLPGNGRTETYTSV